MTELRHNFVLVKDISGFQRRKLTSDLLCRIDSPSKSSKCLTVDGGKYFLVAVKFNNLGCGYSKGHKANISKTFSYELIEPINTCKYPIGKITFNNHECLIKRSAKDQGDFFNFAEKNGILPFCIYDFVNPWLLFIASSLDNLPLRESNSSIKPIQNNTDKIRDINEIINETLSDNYKLLNSKEIEMLCSIFDYPKLDSITMDYVNTGTSFPEQAICFYLRKAFPEYNVYSRDVTYGKEIDVFIPELNLGIEYNGLRGHQNKNKDEEKYEFFKQRGIRLVEICECDSDYVSGDGLYYDYKNGSMKTLENCIHKLFALIHYNPPAIDVIKDQKKILLQFRNEYIIESLGSYYPISMFWWSRRNLPLTPFSLKRSSKYLAGFECPFCRFLWKDKIKKFSNHCPRCQNGFDEKYILNPDRYGFKLDLLLPKIAPVEYEVIEKEDGIGGALNGLMSSYVFNNKRFSGFEFSGSYFSELTDEKVASWYRLISLSPDGKAGGHCPSCNNNYIQSYFDYFDNSKCPCCGENKQEAENIEQLKASNHTYLKKKKKARIAYINEKFEKYINTLTKTDYPSLDSFIEFINKDVSIFKRYSIGDVKDNANVIDTITELRYSFEQNGLIEAYEKCIIKNSGQNILVRDIKEFMPDVLKSSTSRIIKESKNYNNSHHGVVRTD